MAAPAPHSPSGERTVVKWRSGEVRTENVVEAHNADLVRHADAGGLKLLHQPDGEKIVVGQHRRGTAGADIPRRLPAAVDRWFGGLKPHCFQPGPLAGRLYALPAPLGHPGLGRTGHVGDLVVPVRGEAADRLAEPLVTSGNHARHAVDFAVDDHYRLVPGEGTDVVVVHAGARQDEAVHCGHQPAGGSQFGAGDSADSASTRV